MKKWIIIIGVILVVSLGVWFFIFRDTSSFTIKKDGEYEIESGITSVVVTASDVTIKDSNLVELNIESSDAVISIENSSIKNLNISSSDELILGIDENTLVEYLNVLETDDLYINGDFAMVNLNSTNSHIYLQSGVIGNLYSYGSDIEIDIEGDITISNYFVFGVNNLVSIISGNIDYLEIDDESNNNEFYIYGEIDLIVNEGESNTFIIDENASVGSLKTSEDVIGSGEVNELTKSESEIDVDEITSISEEVNSSINDRTEAISSFASTYEVEEAVVNSFVNETGYSIDKVEEIALSLEGSSYGISELLDLSESSGVTNYQIKEIVDYTDNSSLTVVEVVNLFDKLEMESNDISEALTVTADCGLSVSSVLDIYVEAKSADDVSTDLLLDIKDDYDLSVSDIAKLGIHFSSYLDVIS